METTIEKKRTLTAHDRCDSCGAQAYVKVSGVSGELMFCSHHYSKIMNNESSKKAMEEFAYETVNESEFLSDKRQGI